MREKEKRVREEDLAAEPGGLHVENRAPRAHRFAEVERRNAHHERADREEGKSAGRAVGEEHACPRTRRRARA